MYAVADSPNAEKRNVDGVSAACTTIMEWTALASRHLHCEGRPCILARYCALCHAMLVLRVHYVDTYRYTAFMIELRTHGGLMWVVERRFSQFYQLNQVSSEIVAAPRVHSSRATCIGRSLSRWLLPLMWQSLWVTCLRRLLCCLLITTAIAGAQKPL